MTGRMTAAVIRTTAHAAILGVGLTGAATAQTYGGLSADYVAFDSGGTDFAGAVAEARARFARVRPTVVRAGETCAGPCAVVWMAGAQHSGDGEIDMARGLEEGARVAFTLPDVAGQLAAEAGAGDLAPRTREETFALLVDIFSLADEHAWPDGLLDALLAGNGCAVVTRDHDPFRVLTDPIGAIGDAPVAEEACR